jgi:hypothetical protein
VLSGRGLCDELVTRPEESYRLWCVVVCDLETTNFLVNKEEVKAHYGAIAPLEKNIYLCWLCQRTMLQFVYRNDTKYLSPLTQLCMPYVVKCCKH